MNLLQTIISYYHGEARHGFWGAVIGGLLLIGGFVLWKWTSPFSLLKGVSVPMILFGLLIGIGGGADSIYTSKITAGKIALYQKDATTFLKLEKVKVEKTHRGWRGIRIFWGILGLSGLALALLFRKPFWIGAGLGTLVLAFIISLFELYSMRFNERYYHAINAAGTQKPNTEVQEIHPGAQQQTKTQVSEQKQARPASDTTPPQIPPLDSLITLSARRINEVIIKDTLIISTLNILQPLVLANETAQAYHHDKKIRLLDYYNSDLIQADGVSAKHCWFGKKYIK